MESTIVAKGKLEVRGGTLAVTKGKGNRADLEISADTLVVGRNEACDLVLDDKKVSAVHMELVATERGVRVRDLGSRNGTFLQDTRVGEVYLLKPTLLAVGDSVLEFTPTQPEQVDVPEMAEFGPLVGTGPLMRAVFEKLRKAAPTELTVLIGGETGTGKELVAAAIHQASARSSKPFVVVDCGAIPATLAERGQLDAELRDAEVQVASERAGVHLADEVATRRGDDAHVDGPVRVRADRLDALLRERTQQLRLDVDRELSELVEEDRPAVRLDER